ncbi:MAG: MFS transporter, partial [Mycobacteriales bacterium]
MTHSGRAGARAHVTYREVLGVREFAALFAAQLTSGIGDQVAKVALAILVFARSGNPLLAALAYAVTFLPWVIGGPVLSPIADRLPRRQVMIACDVARALIIAAMAIPGLPIVALFLLLTLASTLAPPFEAARAATLPDILDGDHYVVGHSLANITSQFMQVVGFVVGGAIVAALGTRVTLLLDAA